MEVIIPSLAVIAPDLKRNLNPWIVEGKEKA